MDIVDAQTIWQCGMKTVSVSTDNGKTWKAVAGKAGGMGCILSFVDAKTGWLGFGQKFEMTTDGGETWKEVVLPKEVSRVAAVSLRTPKDGYLIDQDGVLHVTQDAGKTWSTQSLGLTSPGIKGFVDPKSPFVNETPQAAVRFTDAKHGLVILGLSSKEKMIALRTADGGKTWKEEALPVDFFGVPYITHDGKFVTVNLWGKGLTVLKSE
jgi:photosystem II stability/assembly factor-like uncharacterized protein